MKNTSSFFKSIYFIANCIFISKRNLMINDANIRRWTFLNRVANIICFMCVERIMFDKNDNSKVARCTKGNCRARSKSVGGIFGFSSGRHVPFRTMTSGLIMHSTISFCRRRSLSPPLRVYPPNNAYDDEILRCILNIILNQFWTTIDGNDLSRCAQNI